MNWNAFFTLHSDLPREGPGLPEDVEWAVRQAGVAEGARVLDAGAGPGGDIAALLAAVPGARITAVDKHADFVEAIADRFPDAPVDARQGDMLDVVGPFDFIWCAGAMYFTGVTRTLDRWKKALAPGGHVAFSQPCYFTDQPSDGAQAFWEGDADTVRTVPGIARRVEAAGYRTIAARPLSDAAWEAYYGPMDARIAKLRPTADATLTEVLEAAEAEAAAWRAHKGETGYLLSVVTPA